MVIGELYFYYLHTFIYNEIYPQIGSEVDKMNYITKHKYFIMKWLYI